MTFCFIRAHFCKNTGAFFAKIRAKIQAKFKFVMLSSFFDLVHIQKVIDLFAKQLNILIYINILITLWTCTKSQKYGQNHKNTGKITKIRAHEIKDSGMWKIRFFKRSVASWNFAAIVTKKPGSRITPIHIQANF